MKRNGIGQLQMNGQISFCASVKRGRRNVINGGPDVGRKIRQSISYMLEHLNQPLQVATLAAVVNVSPSHYSALFKRWAGCPPIDFFIHLRMQHACRLFDSTSLNVKEVAARLGYDDPFYFSRTFKAVNRIAPSEYRTMPEEQRDTIKGAALTVASRKADRSQIIQGKGRESANTRSWASEASKRNSAAIASDFRFSGEKQVKE